MSRDEKVAIALRLGLRKQSIPNLLSQEEYPANFLRTDNREATMNIEK
jgi:hypothetical protein